MRPGRAVAAIVFTAMIGSTVLFAARPAPANSILWHGFRWTIKTSAGRVGPGPNVFAQSNVSVDASGNLHLAITKNASGQWSCAEIIAPASYGYGSYAFNLGSRVDALDANVVLGLFTWSDRAQYAHREIDVEYARWGNAADPTNAQFVVQPYDRPAHLRRFTQPAISASMVRFMWQPGQINWDSTDSSTGALIDSYVYTGTDVPRSGDERVHLNLWLFNGAAPTNGQPVDVILTGFTFTP
jgi:hypothetical protein